MRFAGNLLYIPSKHLSHTWRAPSPVAYPCIRYVPQIIVPFTKILLVYIVNTTPSIWYYKVTFLWKSLVVYFSIKKLIQLTPTQICIAKTTPSMRFELVICCEFPLAVNLWTAASSYGSFKRFVIDLIDSTSYQIATNRLWNAVLWRTKVRFNNIFY